MAHEVRTPPLQPTGVAVGSAVAKRSLMDRVDGGLEGLWHLLTSMRVAMVLMIVLAALCVIGSLVIQIPTGMADDPASKAQWLDTVRPRFGGWTGPMDALGLFNIFNSLVFRVLVAGLVISLIACSVHRIPGAWRTATKPRVDVGPGFFEHAPQHESIVVHAASAEALATVKGVLKKRHYRTLVKDDGTIHLYADRNRFVAFASLAGHISLVLILLGAIVGATFGFKNQYFVVPVGSTVLTGTEDGLALKLNSFKDSYYTDTGAPSDYASDVQLLKNGQPVAAQTIRVNEPLSYNGATYYQRAFGPAVVLTIKDASGKTVYDEGMPLDGSSTDGSDRSAGSLTIPTTGDLINVFATSGTSDTTIQPGQIQVALYGSGADKATATKVFDQGKAQQLGNYTITFDREAKYTVLSISKDPGQILVWIGALLLFAGFTAVFLLPQRRVWARISPRGAMSVLSVASLGRRDAALGTDFDDLITDIRTALQTPAQA
ncbi:MAG TPA: cytochrome c biogenesis protein ResB [Candidatus Limnocylindrales bacterium]